MRHDDVIPSFEGRLPNSVRLVQRSVFPFRPSAETFLHPVVVRIRTRLAVQFRHEEARLAAVREKRATLRVQQLQSKIAAGIGAHVVPVIVYRFQKLRMPRQKLGKRTALGRMERTFWRLDKESKPDCLAQPAEIRFVKRRRKMYSVCLFGTPDNAGGMRHAHERRPMQLREPQTDRRRMYAAERRPIGSPEERFAIAQKKSVFRFVVKALHHRHRIDRLIDLLYVYGDRRHWRGKSRAEYCQCCKCYQCQFHFTRSHLPSRMSATRSFASLPGMKRTRCVACP